MRREIHLVALSPVVVRNARFPPGGNGKDHRISDSEVRGFQLRITRDGSKSYWVKYHLGDRQHAVRLGDALPDRLAAARREAWDIKQAARAGVDLVAERRAKAAAGATFGSLVPQFLAQHRTRRGEPLRQRSMSELRRHLTKVLKPLHAKPLSEIRRSDLVKLLDNIAQKSGPVSADRVKASASVLFAWGMLRDACEQNPTICIPARSNGSRRRVLSGAELQAVWRACGEDSYGRIVRLLLSTACRREEIGGLRWSEINHELQRLELPGERTKGHRDHVVPLSALALSLLPEQPDDPERTPFVFGRYGRQAFGGWSKGKALLDARVTASRKGKALPGWTIHDLRRTVRTQLTELRICDRDLAERILGHARPGIEGVYDRSERLEERRGALSRWSQWLAEAVS